jgi:sugar phosphate isomerase/epimerase
MRIALLTDVFKHAPLTEALAAIRRAGFDAIELNACYNWDPHIDFASEQAEREVALLARLLEQYRLTLAAVAVYPNIASLDAGERQRAVRMCCRAIEVYPGNFIEESTTLLALIERLGLPSLGYLLCVAHVAALGEDVLATYQVAKRRLFHIHVSDTPLRTLDHKHLLPGLGEVDLAALARALRADRYDGTLTLQIYSHEDTAEQSSAEGLKLMRALFG